MSSNLKGQSILSVAQFDLAQLTSLFNTADQLVPIAKGHLKTNILNGAILANLFFEASTRTRMSFHTAFTRLGGCTSDTTGFSFSSISKGESLEDTSKVISSYADVIVMRHPNKGSVSLFSEHATVPVINGGDGPGEHPTQALLDTFTIFREFKKLNKDINGATVALSGDLLHGRTVHSLAKLLSLYEKINFKMVSPKSLAMPEEITQILEDKGHTVEVYNDPYEGFCDADVIYTTRIQKERFDEGLLETHKEQLYTVNKALIEKTAKNDAIVLHPLPRDSRDDAFDLSTDLDDDPRLKIFTQSANGVPVRMSLFLHVLGLEHADLKTEETPWFKRDKA